MLERSLAAYGADPAAAEYLDVLELHDELAEAYDRLARVQDALRHADVLVDPRLTEPIRSALPASGDPDPPR